MEAIVIIGIIFGSITAIILVPYYLRSQERIRVQETLRAAIESGQAMPTEVMENAARNINIRPQPSSGRDLRIGIIWMGVAIGFAAFGIALGFEEPDAVFPIVACACFPGFIGLAFILLGLINRTKS
jgi:cytosine/uracil/thiamine/allantoin permease